jgi:hypothetical protein
MVENLRIAAAADCRARIGRGVRDIPLCLRPLRTESSANSMEERNFPAGDWRRAQPDNYGDYRASRKLTDGSADQEFRGQNPLAEGHLRMMQTLEKHLHAGLAYFLLMDADGGKRWVH